MSRIFAMLFLVMTLVPVTAAPAAAAACSCAMRTPRTSLGEVAAVFSGTVTDVDEPLFDAGEVTATLRPDHVYKGEPEAELRVTTHAQSTACGYRFEEGRRYLIFAGSGRSGLSTTLCSGNLRLPPGERALRLSDRTVGMQPLTPELLAALGTPVPVRAEPAPGRTPAVVAAVTAALAPAVGAVFWLRRRAR
ncbi:hypothetical protein E1295_33345 [Nonomuraea mesophila]|uniref:Tissue inhibitor of metalloproteinase n=1 Tax=Nonomuraea mesophila TaxID=2530382 RepID=A0A4R5EV14_9ACTN|nr:hypothetical protein [Nonomuraea mesophila]TDE38789.1 hypothetical protein E1295_33345 [Nonomuraea mesophila]